MASVVPTYLLEDESPTPILLGSRYLSAAKSSPAEPSAGGLLAPPNIGSDFDHCEYFPRHSVVTSQSTVPVPVIAAAPERSVRQSSLMLQSLPTLNNSVTKKERERFASTLPPHVQVMLDSPFGKESLDRCFTSEACMRHVLLPLWKGGWLEADDWSALAGASFEARTLLDLMKAYGDLDFNALRGYPEGALEETVINMDRVRMSTAALLFFDGNMASLVRWMGGPHVAAHRDTEQILAKWQHVLKAETYTNLARIFRSGVPNACNAASTEENLQAFLEYGNHASLDEDPQKTLKALTKDFKRGYALLFDPRAIHFILHCHVTPIGLTDLNHRYKNPRPFFDSSFRPNPASFAINDWCDKTKEPPLYFADSFSNFLTWLWNLRISYPTSEIYPAEDDIAGAFRHSKYHPNLVSMHTFKQSGLVGTSTGSTFGDEPSPANFEPLANARQQISQYLWYQPDTIQRAQPYLPEITLSPPPTEQQIVQFCPAERDSKNHGVFDECGRRKSPQYDHHVDDNLWADVAEYMRQTCSASVLGLYEVLGFPRPNVPNALSLEKFCGEYCNWRKITGFIVETRAMVVDLPAYKREQAVTELTLFLAQGSFTLMDASVLCGLLESISKYNRWGRVWFFALQNEFRRILKAAYYIALRIWKRKGMDTQLAKKLPAYLFNRFKSLLDREFASLLWRSRSRSNITTDLRDCLTLLRDFLADPANSWAAPIAFIVDRDPHAVSLGDASEYGGGGHCTRLKFWFDIIWSPAMRRAIKLPTDHPEYVHINCLEFIIVILQLAAFTVRLRTLPPATLQQIYPNGTPAMPVLFCYTDNTSAKCWANRITTKSAKGQRLIATYAELLRTGNIGLNAEHIKGILNLIADEISRPTHFDLTHAERAEQIFRKHPSLRTYDYFLPSPELLQSLFSSLSTKPAQVLQNLPNNLGRFVPAGSTISFSPQL